ncbi:unnamed protein product [Amoebophrya sp. A120]|nr:unnamed protein product [Amoebophrya sp. A120]|eukprot:GSA120T00015661001.1
MPRGQPRKTRSAGPPQTEFAAPRGNAMFSSVCVCVCVWASLFLVVPIEFAVYLFQKERPPAALPSDRSGQAFRLSQCPDSTSCDFVSLYIVVLMWMSLWL